MELIWLDSSLKEQGVLHNAEFDAEIGKSYDFTLRVNNTEYEKLANGFVYPRGALEFGGKVTSCVSNSAEGTVQFAGKTWEGLLGLHEVYPFVFVSGSYSGKLGDYLYDILGGALVAGDMKPDSEASAKVVGSISPPAFEGEPFNMLTVYRHLFSKVGLLPKIGASYSNGKMTVRVGYRSAKTYNSLDYPSGVLPMEVEKYFQPVTEIWLYYDVNGSMQTGPRATLQADGTWDTNFTNRRSGFFARRKTLFVSQEEAQTPDWDTIIASVQVQDVAAVHVASELQPDIGDTVTGRDDTTGITVTSTIKSKTLHIVDGVPSITFDTQE